jgi:hypothetical protein
MVLNNGWEVCVVLPAVYSAISASALMVPLSGERAVKSRVCELELHVFGTFVASDETLHIDLPKHSANAHRRRRALNSESSEGLARPLRHEAPTRATSATTRCESAARRRRHHRRGPSQPLSNLLERAPPPPPPRPPHTG